MKNATKRAILAFATLFTMLVPPAIWGQLDLPDHPRFELGANLSILRNSRPGDLTGAGGHFGAYVHKYVALEGDIVHNPGLFGDGPHGETLGLFGAKAGIQNEQAGVFLKLRPGFVHCSDRINCIGVFDHKPNVFALDAGMVLEYYPHQHAYIRLDFGDTMVAYGGTTGTRHYKMLTLGFGVRF